MSIDHGKLLQLASEADAYANDLLSEDGDGPSDYQIATGLHDIASRLRALAQPAEAVCDHRWVTDGLGPTECSRCGVRSSAQPAEAVDAWPKVVQDECLTVLRNMDAEMHVTSRWSARIRHLIDLIAGMKPAEAVEGWDGALQLARTAVYDADGRGMVGASRNQLVQRVARAILNAAPKADAAQGAVAFASSADLERLQGVGPGRFLTIPLWRVQGAGVADTPLYTHPQAAPAQGDVGDDDVRAWAERHGLDGWSLTDARCAFDDARTAAPSPEPRS